MSHTIKLWERAMSISEDIKLNYQNQFRIMPRKLYTINEKFRE